MEYVAVKSLRTVLNTLNSTALPRWYINGRVVDLEHKPSPVRTAMIVTAPTTVSIFVDSKRRPGIRDEAMEPKGMIL